MPSSRSNSQARLCCAIRRRCSRLAKPANDARQVGQLLVEIGAQPLELFGLAQILGRDGLVELGREGLVVRARASRSGRPAGACLRRLRPPHPSRPRPEPRSWARRRLSISPSSMSSAAMSAPSISMVSPASVSRPPPRRCRPDPAAGLRRSGPPPPRGRATTGSAISRLCSSLWIERPKARWSSIETSSLSRSAPARCSIHGRQRSTIFWAAAGGFMPRQPLAHHQRDCILERRI